MKWPWLFGMYFGLCCALGLAQKDDAAALAQAEKLTAQCVTHIASLQQAAAPGAAAHKERYLQALGKLETQLKAKGDISKVIALRDELERAQRNADPLQTKAELPEARQVQQELLAVERTGQQAVAKKLVTLAGDAVAQLAALRKDMNPKNHGRIKQQADQITQHAALVWAHEIAPELTLPQLADPPSDKPVTLKAGKGEPYTFYPAGKEPPLRGGRLLRLEIAFVELRGALANYNLTAAEGGGLPRVGITAKNNDLPDGTKLVIEYYGRFPNPRGYRRESCEHIRLPAIPRGSGLVVDGHGMREYSRKFVGVKSYAAIYGVIISLFDEQGKIILQGCAPSALMQECRREIPDPL